MKRTLFAILCTLLIVTSVLPAQNSSDRVTSDDVLTLSVRVRSRHVDYFEACVPIRLNEPFTIVWGSEKVKEIVSATVAAPIAGEYPTTLKISEGNGQCRDETRAKLNIDEQLQWSNVASSDFPRRRKLSQPILNCKTI